MNLFYSLPVFMKWYYFVLQRQSCRIVKKNSVHVTTLHTCRSSFGFYIWQIYLWYLLVILLAFSLWRYQNQKCTFKFIEQIILDGHPACMEVLLPVLWPIHNAWLKTIPVIIIYTILGAKQNMNWDSTRIVLNWIRLSTLSAWIYTVFPSMLHTLNFTSTQLWSKLVYHCQIYPAFHTAVPQVFSGC